MRTLRSLIAVPLTFVLAAPPLAAAQDRHAVDPSVLSQTVTEQVAKQDADRAAIREALNRPEVRELAARSGIDLDRVQASVDTLNAGALSQVAAAAQQVNQALVGGASTVIISTTTLIIALLIVILIVLIAD